MRWRLALMLLALLMKLTPSLGESTINLELASANLSDALMLLNRFLSLNMVISPAIKGQVNIHLVNVTPSAVLSLLLTSNDLYAKRNQQLLYIAPLYEFIKRTQQTKQWHDLNAQNQPLTMRFWHLRYAKAEEVIRLWHMPANDPGALSYDARTNILVANEVPSRLALIDELIKKTDTPTPQIAIAARLINIDSNYEQDLGIDFANTVSNAMGEYHLATLNLTGHSGFDIKLAALEQAGHAQLISSPSLFALNQQQAVIESGEEVPYQQITSRFLHIYCQCLHSENGGTTIAFKQAVLALKVLPTVMPQGDILLQLQINQDRPSDSLVMGMPRITTRKILTNVLVRSGRTVVLGGIFETDKENNNQMVPFLSKIPLIGVLFKKQNVRETRRELLIFITPRIVTQET